MYSQIAANKRKTVFLMIFFVVIVSMIGSAFAYYYQSSAMAVAIFIGAAIYALVGYKTSAKVALTMSGAKPITKSDNERLYKLVENLAITDGVPTPKIYIIEDETPNAFATGTDPNNSHIAFTTGILNILDESELQGVAAHELSHIKNYDIRVMSVVMVLVMVIALMSDIFSRSLWFGGRDRDDNNSGNGMLMILAIVSIILAPLVASLVKLAISRQREYLADASGVMLTRYPEGLASALKKIGEYSRPMRKVNSATAHLFIDNPMSGKDKSDSLKFSSLFDTHPPIDKRVARILDSGKGE